MDLDTYELEFVPNPTSMFHKILYNETTQQLLNPNKYKNSYIKIVVEDKATPAQLAQLVEKLSKVGVHDLKVMEHVCTSIDDDVEIEGEDTLTTLTNYVMAMDESIDKDNIVQIFKSLYIEAQEV